MNKWHGWYSPEAARHFGTHKYKQGEEIVEVTAVTREHHGREYLLPDKKYVGTVDDYIGPGRVSC